MFFKGFTNTGFNTKIGEFENKISVVIGSVTNADFRTKIGEVKKYRY